MLTLTSVRRTGAALAASALVLSLVSTGGAADAASTTSPAGRAATWSGRQLTKGLVFNPTFGGFNDYGLTLDTGFALKAAGHHKKAVARVRRAMSHHVSDYTTDSSFGFGDVFSGSIAKLLVFAQETGGGARTFGGTNLVKALDARVETSGSTKGRIHDVVDPSNPSGADFANTLGQVWAVRGLLAADDSLAKPALHYLMLRQCGQGFFTLDLGHGSVTATSCRKKHADNDVTALAVIELWRYRHGHGTLVKGLPAAVHWLAGQEDGSGGLGEVPGNADDANTSGLAAWALGMAGKCGAAAKAASFVSSLQVGGGLAGTPLAGQRGAIAVDHSALHKGRRHGITRKQQQFWRSATAQAGPGLQFLGGKNCR
jgi:hypothetical protein